jgi:hypothetical protein
MTRFVIDAPVAIRLATEATPVAAGHTLVAPTLLRSQVLALTYAAVREGTMEQRDAKRILDDIRSLRIRLLGDRVQQAYAWKVARTLDWPNSSSRTNGGACGTGGRPA